MRVESARMLTSSPPWLSARHAAGVMPGSPAALHPVFNCGRAACVTFSSALASVAILHRVFGTARRSRSLGGTSGASASRAEGSPVVRRMAAEEEASISTIAMVGLGNVGDRYVGTRHNIGFEAVDASAAALLAPDQDGSVRWVLPIDERTGSPILWREQHGGSLLKLVRPHAKGKESGSQHGAGVGGSVATQLILFKPLSNMNRSGGPTADLVRAIDLPEDRLVVAYDDLDTDVGRARLRTKGSAGGQNGVKSIIAHGLSRFLRIRIGIGRPPRSAGKAAVVSHVLSPFLPEERAACAEALRVAASAVADLADGTTAANVMNRWNTAKQSSLAGGEQ